MHEEGSPTSLNTAFFTLISSLLREPMGHSGRNVDPPTLPLLPTTLNNYDMTSNTGTETDWVTYS